jgi:hypothetical protein
MTTRKARKNDPITSHLAAASATQETLTRIENHVLGIFKTGLQLTDEDLVNVYTRNGYPGTPQGIRTARNELATRGKLEIVGIGKTSHGRKARIWAVIL